MRSAAGHIPRKRFGQNFLIDDGIIAIPRGLTQEDIALLGSAFPVIGQEGNSKKKS